MHLSSGVSWLGKLFHTQQEPRARTVDEQSGLGRSAGACWYVGTHPALQRHRNGKLCVLPDLMAIRFVFFDGSRPCGYLT